MTDTVIIQIFTGVTALIGTIFSGVMTYMIAKLNATQKIRNRQQRKFAREAKQAAVVNAREVKMTLEESDRYRNDKLDKLAAVTHANHLLVNNNMLIQLRLNMVLAAQLAEVFKDPVHVEAARIAKEAYEGHLEGQNKIDAMASPEPDKPREGDV